MASIGKKILSAFVEVTEEAKPVTSEEKTFTPVNNAATKPMNTANSSKFKEHFDQLFKEAEIQGPDYFEFAKMIEAMHCIPDEATRYNAAFAGLTVQGLNKQHLLSTTKQYLVLLDEDAENFNATIDTTLQEKVQTRKQEIETKSRRIQQLSQELASLQQEIALMGQEVKEQEEKIQNNTNNYKTELEKIKSNILQDIEKIKQYIN
ncbi:hypothetical protein OCK74_09445 [Chitinophagaceae bacterium LB-8]|uniref:Uncharacterized protein n=1 Tax=Paraflavisolibacter caeni TaxID=2982496 RepID=A0A9X3BHC3_9BACT|nr:hypothetical protein [Paraflavisolibacter caeni]MCU7549337.1 hypothetical protein [Paraflavisolibacter caeni]